MSTEYHCKNCGESFSEEALPNINKVHIKCGGVAKVHHYRLEESAA